MIFTISSLIVLAGCGVIGCVSSWRVVGEDEGCGLAEADGEGGSESGAARSSAPMMIRMPV
jgi:hypothetical protein